MGPCIYWFDQIIFREDLEAAARRQENSKVRIENRANSMKNSFPGP